MSVRVTLISVEKTYVSAFNQQFSPTFLHRGHERNTIDSMLGQLGTVLFEADKFLLNVVLEQVSIALLVPIRQTTDLGLEQLDVEDLGQPNAASL